MSIRQQSFLRSLAKDDNYDKIGVRTEDSIGVQVRQSAVDRNSTEGRKNGKVAFERRDQLVIIRLENR